MLIVAVGGYRNNATSFSLTFKRFNNETFFTTCHAPGVPRQRFIHPK
jgi:hypothetical protein